MQVLQTPQRSMAFWSRGLFLALLALSLGSPSLGRAAEPPAAQPSLPAETTASSGDSWTSIRGRLCPIEIVQESNAELAKRNLRPGDVIHSPFVPAGELERAKSRHGELETRLSAALQRQAELEARIGSFETLQQELAAVRAEEIEARRASTVLLGVTAVAIALFVLALVFALAIRQESERSSKRLTDAEDRYADLRRSLQSLEVHLQKRMLDLLGVHKTNVSDEQLNAATLPVIEMAERLKRRHAS